MKRGWWAVGLVGLLAACESTSVPKTDLPDSPNPGIDAGADGAPLPPGTIAPKLAPIGKQTIVIGKTTSFRVSVERGSLTGPLELTFAALPAGVTAKSDPIAADASFTEVTLSATETAPFGTVKPSVQVGKDASLSVPFDLEIRGVPGTLDKSFGSEGSRLLATDGRTQYFAVLPDGSSLGETLFGTLTKRMPNGAVDSSFGSQGVVELADFVGVGLNVNVPAAPLLDATGSAFAAYEYAAPGGTRGRRAFVVKLTPRGARDSSFGSNGLCALPELAEGSSHNIRALTLLDDGSIVVTTRVSNATTSTWTLRHVTKDGTLDTTWGPLGDGTIVLDTVNDGVFLVAAAPPGGFYAAVLSQSIWQGRWTKAGLPDPAFGLGLGYTVTPNILPMPGARLCSKRRDGSLEVGFNEGDYARTSRYNPAGTADTAYVSRPTQIPSRGGRSTGALVDSLGRTYFGFQESDATLVDLWRLNADGSIDTSLNGTGKFRFVLPQNIAGLGSSLSSVHELADGRILAFVSAYGGIVAYRFWP